jgi:KDO2-lipid IV(A) lauroyltransferase
MPLVILKITAYVIGHMPRALVLFLGRALGALAYRVDARHRARAMENLERAFGPGLGGAEMRRVCRGVFTNLATNALEFMRMPWLGSADLAGYVECEGLDNLRRALSRGKGAIILTAHFGNWELLAAFFGLSGFSTDIVARELDSPLAERFVTWARTRCGNRVISKRGAMRRLLMVLGDNGIVTILLDQNVMRSEGVFVDFFGSPACTNKGPALLASASGAAVVPTFIMRAGAGHRLVIGEELTLASTGDRERDVVENTAKFTMVIERIIRERPEEWFWVHRRWKTRPLPVAEGAVRHGPFGRLC